jgi:hypothetical protein
MGGALLDLVAKGGQDVYFICNPQMSFFKKVYKRHTNFSCEFQKYQFDSSLDFGKTTNFIIPRQGDLIKNIFLQFELPNLNTSSSNKASYVNYIGYALIDYVEIYINTQKIDKLTGEWLYIYNELIVEESKKRGYNSMIGGKDFITYDAEYGNKGDTYIIPLNFWFNQEIGSALPYCALQYSDIEIKLKLKKFNDLWITMDGTAPEGDYKIINSHICIERIYLDSKERKEFATQSHEYLIKQTQYSLNNNVLANTTNKTFNLNFNHPILELIFVVHNKTKLTNSANGGKDYFNYSKTNTYPLTETIKNAKILLNGEDRTPEITNKELRFLNPILYHTSIPNNYIYMYSFSLNPEDYQPSGSCNFSRFDNKQLRIEFEDNIEHSELKIFAINYNILRITQGLGGLAYLN